MIQPVGYGWFALLGVGGLVVAAIAVERWWSERRRNEEIKAALRAYLRDFTPRDDGDRRALENRRRFIAKLAELPLGELAPEWPVEQDPHEEPAAAEDEWAPLRVLQRATR